jgi:hypothetical protein
MCCGGQAEETNVQKKFGVTASMALRISNLLRSRQGVGLSLGLRVEVFTAFNGKIRKFAGLYLLILLAIPAFLMRTFFMQT